MSLPFSIRPINFDRFDAFYKRFTFVDHNLGIFTNKKRGDKPGIKSLAVADRILKAYGDDDDRNQSAKFIQDYNF